VMKHHYFFGRMFEDELPVLFNLSNSWRIPNDFKDETFAFEDGRFIDCIE